MNIESMSNEQYGFLFDVRRSIRYHDRRRAFFERLHQITGGLTVLLAGSVLFDIARPGDSPWWLLAIAAVAALLSAWDIVVGYASKATLHRDLKGRFCELEAKIFVGDAAADTWASYRAARLRIEQDEPPIYRALDLLCHNELLLAEGYGRDGDDGKHFVTVPGFKRLTSHFIHWANWRAA